MSTMYVSLASKIVDLVGGPSNVRSVYHCQTRLRFELKDDDKVNVNELSATEGVVTTRNSGGTFQIVIGTHVKDVFEEVDRELAQAGVNVAVADSAEASGSSENQGSENSEKGSKQSIGGAIIDFISGTFQPIIPALAGGGMLAAIVALLVVFNIITRESQTYAVLSFMSNAVFYFLPIFVAISAADKLKANRILAGGVAAMLLHPNWSTMVTAGEPVHLFDAIPVTLASYGSTVVPMLIIVVVQAHFERWLEKFVPNSVKLVVIPMVVFFVIGILALTVLGPIGTIMGNGLAVVFEFLVEKAPWIPPVLIGSLLPVMVMFGIHTAVGPLGYAQLAEMGFDSIFGPGAIVSNIAIGVASLVVAFRTREKKLRQIAMAGGITGLMGITEPALYGVALPKKYPLISAMIGGGVAGLYVGLTSTHRFAVGASGLPAVFLYIGDDTLRHFVNILIALVIATVVTAAVTLLLSFKYEKSIPSSAVTVEETEPVVDAEPLVESEAPVRTATQFLTSPVQGEIVALSDIPDAAFASGAIGAGLGIEPTNGTIVSPVSGTIIAAMKSGHAFGIRSDDGVEVLVHIGVDTVQMKGEGFTNALPKGTRVQVGDKLVDVNLDAVKSAGHPATVILVVTNSKHPEFIEPATSGNVIAGEPIITITDHN